MNSVVFGTYNTTVVVHSWQPVSITKPAHRASRRRLRPTQGARTPVRPSSRKLPRFNKASSRAYIHKTARATAMMFVPTYVVHGYFVSTFDFDQGPPKLLSKFYCRSAAAFHQHKQTPTEPTQQGAQRFSARGGKDEKMER